MIYNRLFIISFYTVILQTDMFSHCVCAAERSVQFLLAETLKMHPISLICHFLDPRLNWRLLKLYVSFNFVLISDNIANSFCVEGNKGCVYVYVSMLKVRGAY